MRILQEIRDEQRGTRTDIQAMNARFDARFEAMNARFEIIETTLRDLAQQLVLLGRAVKVA